MNKYRTLIKGGITTVAEAIAALEGTRSNRSEPRTGIRTPREKLDEIERRFLVPLVKEKEQSLLEIYQTHGPEMPVSIVTLYSYIDRMAFSTIRNIDLAKKAKYPARYKKKAEEPTNKAFLSKKVPALNGYRFIKPDEVKLTPNLIR